MGSVVSKDNTARILRIKQFSDGFACVLDNTRRGNRHAVTGSAGISTRLTKIFDHTDADSRRLRPARGGGNKRNQADIPFSAVRDTVNSYKMSDRDQGSV